MKSPARFFPVSITGIGAISCAGDTLESFWQNALAEKSGLNDAGVGLISETHEDRMCKPARLARRAIRAAMEEAGWSRLNEDDGLIIATTVGQIPLWETALTHYLTKTSDAHELLGIKDALRQQPLGSIIETLAGDLDFRGKSFLVTSACSASTQAIGLAAQWVRQGRVKRCLVGGTEVLSRLTLEGFRSLQLLAPQICRPFDEARQGINLSEGAAFFCLESESPREIAQISGMGFSTDAYHMAAPHPEGRGSFVAMKNAITMAGLAPSDIQWVHAHGTGSKANDRAEGAAIEQLFGSAGSAATAGTPGTRVVPWVSSTKALHGHALGASGAIETALCLQALRKQVVLRTGGLQKPDPLISVRHPSRHLSCEIRHVVKNTLGFGGNNASLVLSLSPGAR